MVFKGNEYEELLNTFEKTETRVKEITEKDDKETIKLHRRNIVYAYNKKISRKTKTDKLNQLKRPMHKTYGLPYKLSLKVGIRYMVTVNIDIEEVPQVLYIEFDCDYVGYEAKESIQVI